MKLFLPVSFALLGVLYWLLSGGPNFVPETREAVVASAAEGSDVEVTRAEAPTDELLAPAPELGALTLQPAAVAVASADPAPTNSPDLGPPEEALEPTEALAALAPDLAAEPAAATPESLVEAAAPAGEGRVVTGDRVNLREGPGTGFGVVGQLVEGERAAVLELRDGWAWVRVGAVEGWMSERFLAAP